MVIKKIEIEECIIWITVTPYYPAQMSNTQLSPIGYICYFSFQEPNLFFMGELIKDEAGNIKIFLSPEEALEYCLKYLSSRCNRNRSINQPIPISKTLLSVDLNEYFGAERIERMKKDAGIQ